MDETAERGAAGLLQAITDRWSAAPAEVVEVATAAWPAMARRPPCPEDAETCRQVMLAAGRLGLRSEASAWKARAVLRFAALGWAEGVAAALVSEFYVAMAHTNDSYEGGMHLGVLRPSADAQAVLDELRAVGRAGRRPYPYGPDGALLMRLALEKTGLLLLLAGRLDEAREELEQALEHVGADWRGELKVRAGLAMLAYLSARAMGTDAAEAAGPTALLAGTPEADSAPDVGGLLRENLERMRAGRTDLLVYETL